ncbi:hypothetical protein [Mesorhizobium sp. 113-1-2]|uniref:hypothetical protein n=1 Tax=Mesorhizobium sp. 113-1-2 TaxID=2744515 RepID=UPI001926CA23|nr:hypothetical protein [Mesorhizobium sp. 113-1-2]
MSPTISFALTCSPRKTTPKIDAVTGLTATETATSVVVDHLAQRLRLSAMGS